MGQNRPQRSRLQKYKQTNIQGAKVWIQHPEKIWEGAILLDDYKSTDTSIKLQIDDTREQRVVEVKTDKELPPLRNPDILIGENNLTSLSFLHEPAVLYNLQVRFQRRCIYTYCGIVLVAFNPYDELPIYGNDTIWAYRGQAMGDLEPHIFAVAEEAYTKLERELHDQSIIVSGESGAGKTVSAKYAMRYFATVGGSSTETQIEKKVLASSPLMEAFGNAKTTRNDNSSRFGKFIEIQFNKNYHITGASIRTYLLEKSRVVFQAHQERNYHIFYQLCAAATSPPQASPSDVSARLKNLQLDKGSSFHYLNQGNCFTIDNLDDSRTFQDTLSAMTRLGFESKQQEEVFKILAAILHLGNVEIVQDSRASEGGDSEACMIASGDRHLTILAQLMGIDPSGMRKWLCHRKIVSMRDVILKPMNVEQAIGARDALAKHIYAELFNFIVHGINESLRSKVKASLSFIGVLDIYGFETFEINSFEQFCINYANEKLQQQFNQHVFKLEQEEYLKEEIEWTFIDFYDNQPCIDLIETKLGILDLLDEECRMPRGSDDSWAEKLYSKCVKSKHFERPRFGTNAFLIHHFADLVEYSTIGFLDKNRDTVMEEQIDVLRSSDNKLLKQLFNDDPPKLSVPSGQSKIKISAQKPLANAAPKQNKKTVGSQFRDSLNMLMSTLNATTPHYVRCIKPNDSKESFEYDAQRAIQQLRACGVLETIRISAAGFPSQRTYADFFSRYRCLCPFKEILREDLKETCRRILKYYIKDEDKFKFGKTKVLFRAGQVAYLEKLRSEKQKDACRMIQKRVRGFIIRRRYQEIRKAVLGLQRHARGYLARVKAQRIRRERAAVKIQTSIRGWVARTRYLRVRRTIISLQRYARGLLARKKYAIMKDNAAATTIQRFARGYLVRAAVKQKINNIIIVQCCVRKYLARRIFRRLKAEAKSVEHVKTLNKGLEKKIISMQHRINEILKENQALRVVQTEVVDLKVKLEAMKAVELENKKLVGVLVEKDRELELMAETVKREQDEKMDLLLEREKLIKEKEDENKRLSEETERLKRELAVASEKLKIDQRGAEENLKHRLEQEKDLLLMDHDQDRGAYQRLLKDYQDLEEHVEVLERKLALHAPGEGHSRSLSNASSGSVGQAASTDVPEENIDFGYGSVRSTVSSTAYSRVETIDWHQRRSESPPDGEAQPSKPVENGNGGLVAAPVDIGLVLKLQQKLKDVESSYGRLVRTMEDLERDSGEDALRTQDTFKLEELEMENAQLKKDLGTLRKAVVDGDVNSAQKELTSQFDALQEELERRREECIQLHSVLADNTKRMKSLGSNYGRDVDIINEDGELALAFEAQKKINRQLEDELQTKEKGWREQRNEWRNEIDRLQEEMQKLQKLLSVNLSNTPKTQTEAFMQHEIVKITSEYLDLQEKYDKVAEECQKLKKRCRIFAKRLRDAGCEDSEPKQLPEPPKPRAFMITAPVPDTVDPAPNQSVITSQQSNGTVMPAIRKKERDYEGMFEFRKEDITSIIRNLVIELKPKVAVTLLPGLPAYILFMCIRHTDCINDDDKVTSLLTGYLNAVKRVIKKRDDFDSTVLWLSNTLRILHNLKQYSGDKPFQMENTARQNEQCLRNFDLSEYRSVLSNVGVWIFGHVMTILKERIQALTVPALLEHEAITGLNSNKSGRPRSSSVGEEPESTQQKLNKLLDELGLIHKTMQYHGVDKDVIVQIFKQLFYFMCASALNNLLLRNELCHWTKGMQIRYNLSHIEQWARDEQLVPAIESLQPIIQAAQLLQARKTDEDVNAVCEMCNKLTSNQIIKILHLYTPADEYETRVPVTFIQNVQEKLKQRQENNEQVFFYFIYYA
ncbi:Similar to MYO5A: Unconventional myosin-Va (Gallus gallus) [Cotesia congregata]|uniref:Similar to MYO5A: Unconventional myosin-Va (Gallus gallus) n=1 Tax=Cotesia congregata TaxID=51543 RepID=A0A8J2MQ06_COTCN|nr:Similar to MYO5A: Unconventional myosin-Va (Gallus gallus) [Cotesia congregata]